MSVLICGKKKGLTGAHYLPKLLTAALVVVITCGIAQGAIPNQRTFGSPEEAFKTVVEAVKASDKKALRAVLGPGANELVFPRDANGDESRFVRAYEEKRMVEPAGPRKAVLLVGIEDWPWPIPVVKVGHRWRFDTEAGKQEILARRIGSDEVAVVQVCLAYVDAQREYAANHHTGGLPEYAQSFAGQGMTEGLCGTEENKGPLGPLIAEARERNSSGGEARPYHGYFYNILTKQGDHGPGGAYDYVVDGRMIGGFALVAYPASYGASGIMTFLVSQDGVIYEKDLGKDTRKIAEAMTIFDPDRTWKKVE